MPEAQKAKVQTDAWELKEIEALNRALAHFAPLLGQRRAESSQKDIPQQVTTFSKLHETITDNSPTGHPDGNELSKAGGEYFSQARNVSLLSAGTNKTSFGFNNEQQLEGTAIHELAHGLLGYRMLDFTKAVGYWQDPLVDRSTASGGERSITPYGGTNPDDDLAETVRYFFMKPEVLKQKCPKRYEFMQAEVASWNAKKK